MKKNRYILLATTALLAAGTLTSCMNGDDGLTNDDWTAPTITTSPYGNNSLTESNVITIKELKEKTVNTIAASTANDTIRITEDWQIKGRVMGNDIASNIYNEVALEDESGEAILVCVQKGGLFGIMPVGQEILLSLKDLYIGIYGNMPQIGLPYTNSSNKTFPSRMPFETFNDHFKIIGQPDATKVQPEEFDVTKFNNADYCKSHRGKLMTVKGVTMKDAGALWAPDAEKDAGNGVSRTVLVNGKSLKNSGSSYDALVVRSSSYADFANDVIPSGKVNLTGIFTVYASNASRYGYTWQILLRSADDIEVAE